MKSGSGNKITKINILYFKILFKGENEKRCFRLDKN